MVSIRFIIDMDEDIRTAMYFTRSRMIAGGVNFTGNIIKELPVLRSIIGKSASARKNAIKKALPEHYRSIIDGLKSSKKRFEKVSSSFDSIKLERYMQSEVGVCRAYVSVFDCNPVYPDKKKFQIYYKASNEKALKTVVHEIIHILYNRHRLASINRLPKGKKWMLSEIVDELVMEKFGLSQGGYPEHRKHFNAFKKLMKESADFKSFLNQAAESATGL